MKGWRDTIFWPFKANNEDQLNAIEVWNKAETTWLFLSGGKGSGKTMLEQDFLIGPIMDHAGMRSLIAGPTEEQNEDTLGGRVWEMFSTLKGWRATTNEDCIYGPEGREIVFRGLENPKRCQGMEAGMIAVDEAEEIRFPEQAFEVLVGCLRQQKPDYLRRFAKDDYPRKGVLAANPTRFTGYFRRRFDWNGDEEHRLCYLSTLKNAANLPPKYIESLLKNYKGARREQMINGHWAKDSGGMFEGYDAANQITIGQWRDILGSAREWTVAYGMDFGAGDPTAIEILYIINGIGYFAGELYGLYYIGQKKDWVRKYVPGAASDGLIPPATYGYGDQHGKQEILELNNPGETYRLKVKGVGMDRDGRYQCFRDLIESKHIVIVPELCPMLHKTLPQLRFDRNGDFLEHQEDHAYDAASYVAVSLIRRLRRIEIPDDQPRLREPRRERVIIV